MSDIFLMLSFILLLSTALALLLKIVRLPTIIAFLLAGVIIPFILGEVNNTDYAISTFSQMGVAFLLFIVGLKLDMRIFRELGYQTFILTFLQMFVLIAITFLFMTFMGYDIYSSLLWGIALSFSSTVIVVKLLSDKGDIEKLNGQISLGVLIIQDIIALLVLIILPSLSGINNDVNMLSLIVNWLFIITSLFIVSIYLLPRLLDYMSKSKDLLFMFAIAWCFVIGTLFEHIGLGMEVGALLAGLSLSSSEYSFDISVKVKPLRDFFIILFFVSLGFMLDVEVAINNLVLISILSVIVIFGKIISVYLILRFMGYRKRVAFLSAVSLSQISEFSFILFAFATSINLISLNNIGILTAVGLMTMGISSYLLINVDKIYFTIFKAHNVKTLKKRRAPEVVLFGYDRVGYDLVKSFNELGFSYEVVDYDPDIVHKLQSKEINVIYGDATDSEFVNELNLVKSKLVISTIPDMEVNLNIFNSIQLANEKRKPIFIATAHKIDDALLLYQKGVHYVIMPHFLGGKHVSNLIKSARINRRLFKNFKNNHMRELKERKKMGHEHPTLDYKP